MAASNTPAPSIRPGQWKFRVYWGLGATTVLAIAMVTRWFWGAATADAQSPRGLRTAAESPTAAETAPATTASPTKPDATAQAAANGIKTLQVMALVNSEQITRADLAQECLRRFGKETLEAMVNRYLILAACRAQNVTVTDEEIEKEVTSLASRFGLSADRWLEMLQKERNITPEQYRSDLIWPTLALRKLSNGQTEVTAQELNDAFDAQYGPKVKVRMINVSSAKMAADIQAKAAAKPEDFSKFVKEFSEDSASASTGGLMPPIHHHGGNPELEQVAFALRDGEVSRVVKVANQFVILKCEQHLPPSEGMTAAARKEAETKLVQTIRDKKLRGVANDLLKKLQDESKIENIYNNPAKQQQMPGVAAVVNGRQMTVRELSDECLVRHAREVLEGEINRRLLLQALRARGQQVAEPDIDNEIQRAARTYGFAKRDGSADVEAWLKKVQEEQNVTVELYVRDAVWPTVALKKLVGDVQVTEEELKKGFEANYGERVEVQVCVLDSQKTAQKVWEEARNNPNEEFFAKLATQYSAEQLSKANGGRIPPIRKWGGQPLVEKEAFSLKAGELSGIIPVADKFIIMRCIGRTKPVVVDFKEVKDQLLEDLQEKHQRLAMASKFDDLRSSAKYENFLTGELHNPKPSGVSTFGKQGPLVVPGAKDAANSQPARPLSSGVVPASATGPIPSSNGQPTSSSRSVGASAEGSSRR